MILSELVGYFREQKGDYHDFCNNFSLDEDSEVIEVYMKSPIALSNELFFFAIEDTEGKVEYNLNGSDYLNLFDFYYFLDFMEEAKETDLTNEEIAKTLLSYAKSDA